ncbi:hypothetical protein [Streptomyces sp. NBC_00829]|uniref:hypothetical protein n=1 Tax=Streptomyces sp. NBC_00829 TaxID=2903679 RepID=UPI00386FAC2E|nr:hypothetical protein OG293_09785 [Streptomyces sp. NBC_00829]
MSSKNTLVAVAAGLLLVAPAGHGAAHADDEDSTAQNSAPAVQRPPVQLVPVGLNLVLIDNSGADSWLEVDRTANSQSGTGTAGSDHEGE